MARPRLVSDEQILATARRMVLAQGPSVSVDRIATDLGVTAPALLKRFGSRDALLLAALKPPENPAWVERAEQGPGGGTLSEELRALFTSISDFVREIVPCMIALRMSGIPASATIPPPEGPERARRAVQTWLKLARDRGLVTVDELDSAAYAMLGALQTRAFFAHLQNRPFTEAQQRKYVDDLTRLYTRALAPKADSRP